MVSNDRSAISDQRDCQDSADPVDRALPTDRTDPTEPMLPIEATEPMLPIESSDPREPIDSTESAEHSERREEPVDVITASSRKRLPQHSRRTGAGDSVGCVRPRSEGDCHVGSPHFVCVSR